MRPFLVSGREREYLQWFFNFRISNPAAITDVDFQAYLTGYAAPGALRAGSHTAPLVRGMMEEVSSEARVLSIAGAGHWIAEENPEDFAAGLIDFLEGKETVRGRTTLAPSNHFE